jgi:hypothetical protein
MHRQDDGGVALQFGGDGGHGIQSTGRGCQIGAHGIEPHFAGQNPS